MTPKKLLLISVSNGAGHVRAAEAIRKTMLIEHPDVVVEHIDMIDYIQLPMKTVVVKTYEILVKQLPQLWGFLYRKTDSAHTTGQYHHVSKLMNRMNATPFYDKIEQFDPDYIVCTHFLPAQAIFDRPKRYKNTARLAAVMTDYYNHSFLVHPNIETYFVATEKLKWMLTHKGITADNIVASGIPVDPVFYENKPLEALRAKYHLSSQDKVTLILSGGQGLAHISKIAEELFHVTPPMTIFAVAGTNAALLKKLSALTPPSHIRLIPLGWTDAIDEYMRLADVIITKPGGLTTTECVVLGKTIVAIQPIPGQEEYNAEYILDHGYGHVAHGPLDLVYYTTQALNSLLENKKATPPCAARLISDVIYNKLSSSTAPADLV